MRIIGTIITVVILLTTVGCELEPVVSPVTSDGAKPCTMAGFEIRKIHIVGLSNIGTSSINDANKSVKVYVDTLDSFETRIKAPCTFRFELYEYVPRSSQNLGERQAIWPDIDLTAADANNGCWRDHLRAYQFELPLEIVLKPGMSYVIQATCMTVNGSRIIDSFKLQ